MAAPADSGGKDEVKTQFATREGTYRLMALSEYSRPNRVGYTSAGGGGACPVRVSLVSLPCAGPAALDDEEAADAPDRICFNHGKELYVYAYRGIKKAADLTKPVDKKMYKGTNPTCHDFNATTATHDSASLLIGFSTGQIQLIDPIKKEISKLFNEERVVDKSRVTCIRWVPASGSEFVAAHASGALYCYDALLPCAPAAPLYARHVSGPGYVVCNARSRSARNPVRRWSLGGGACINEFAWSPCGTKLATAGQDGFLRVFDYSAMTLEGRARSYFGGLLSVAWSGDGHLVAVGGEDDLVTLWSARERRVAARLMGHRSWVAVVAFDHHAGHEAGTYRLGSVAQDTQLCLWEVAEDALRPTARSRAPVSPPAVPSEPPQPSGEPNGAVGPKARTKPDHTALSTRLAGFSFGDRRAASANARNRGSARDGATLDAGDDNDPLAAIGTVLCPRFDEVPVLEPLVVKKIAHERLTALHFLPECFITACADGCVNTWARPPCRLGPPAHSRPPSQ